MTYSQSHSASGSVSRLGGVAGLMDNKAAQVDERMIMAAIVGVEQAEAREADVAAAVHRIHHHSFIAAAAIDRLVQHH